MGNNTNGIVKPQEKNGKALTYRNTFFRGVSEFFCSTFIKNKNVLVKGEYKNGHKDKRNALILLMDCDSQNIIG